ncbi:type I pullulanase [Tuanshanicoccus lijuaniae]|uniref:type I pullulanase n=1 Tax=Aerococcaceae bacterium zg-1292 TaxID=2774330 RepID=UPI001BD8BE45|nr:type I pullulanase [Aerococcaceae bacterium zg-A91]MBS4457954.1 type I pullulanase [Aerococcaceae bacterium zg-BR33]
MKRYKSLALDEYRPQPQTRTFKLNPKIAELEKLHYAGELGAIYTAEQTEFRLWAPTAHTVELVIYEDYYAPVLEKYLMTKEEEAVWTIKVDGDCHGMTYRYEVTFEDGSSRRSVDPYSKAVTVNGKRSVVVDLSRTNPEGWGERMAPFSAPTDAVIYELHVRDFTADKNSGVTKRGKFLGAIETGTKNPLGSSTGIDYIKQLGVTHVEFLPMFDYASVDETGEDPTQYNWGYDPLNYNAPEGSYSTNAYDPFVRIKEMKQMIQGFHDAGIRIIMDVVYNHVYEVENHSFHRTVPGYFFRHTESGQFSNGTGVGNDTASERAMVRKYIVDSVTYWAKEYHIDGFRFDLMGIHDVETMNEIRRALDEIDSSIIMLGEGWELMTELPFEKKASHYQAKRMARIGQFNDSLREALKGNDFDAHTRGFINGAWYMENQVAGNIMAGLGLDYYLEPGQVIQYVEAHDNYTLYDRLVTADPHMDRDTIIRRHELATSIILLSQGVPFIHAGQEFLRTKYGVRDSYNQPNHINQLDWLRQENYEHTVCLVRGLIALRKAEPMFRLKTYEEIQRTMRILHASYQMVALEYSNDDERMIVVYNAQENPLAYSLEYGDYIMKLVDGQVHLSDDYMTGMIDHFLIEPYTALVLKQKK